MANLCWEDINEVGDYGKLEGLSPDQEPANCYHNGRWDTSLLFLEEARNFKFYMKPPDF